MTSFRIIALVATMAFIAPSVASARGGGYNGGNHIANSGNGTGNTVHFQATRRTGYRGTVNRGTANRGTCC